MSKVTRVQVDAGNPLIRPFSMVPERTKDVVRFSANRVIYGSNVYKQIAADGSVTIYFYNNFNSEWIIFSSSAKEELDKVNNQSQKSTPWSRRKVYEWWPGGRPGSSGGSNIR